MNNKRGPRSCRERGNVTFVMAGVVLAVGLCFVSMLRIARAAIEVSTAQSAADAVALAAAVGGTDAANRVAAQNSVRLVRLDSSPPDVVVTVALIDGGQEATAKAEADSDERRPIQIEYWVRGP